MINIIKNNILYDLLENKSLNFLQIKVKYIQNK